VTNYPDSSRQLRLAIHTSDQAALLYSVSIISILNDAELRQHPYVSCLGPDLLDPGVDAELSWFMPRDISGRLS